MRRNALEPNDDEMEYGDYLCDERRAEKRERQAEMFNKPLAPDVFTLLRIFENWRGIDEPQSFPELLQHYHGALDDPSSRESWGKCRLSRAIDAAFDQGLIEYEHKWQITAKGAQARKAETVRRMRG